jgi:AraC family transcriptional regulator
MQTRGGEAPEAVLSGSTRISRQWSGLRAEYAWLPPFRGSALTKPNRVEVVFSEHDDVIIDQQEHAYEVRVPPGGLYVVGEQPTTLLRVGAYSDTLEMYPDLALLREVARSRGLRAFELEPTLRGWRSLTFARDAVILGAAHRLRRACMNRLTISEIEAGTLAHLIAERLVSLQHGESRPSPAPQRLSGRTIARVAEFVEARLTGPLLLEELARAAELSPFHFARCFKNTTGLAPHQYVLARRFELAKRLIMTTRQSVQQVAWSVGFENISHFRRQFAAQIGVMPGVLRRATRSPDLITMPVESTRRRMSEGPSPV